MSGQKTNSPSAEGQQASCCAPASHSLSEGDIATDVQTLSTLGNDTRYEALRLIAESDDGVCVCEIEPALGVSQSAISQALSKLFTAGLVERRKDGRWRYYSATPRAERLLDVLDETKNMTDETPTPDADDGLTALEQHTAVRERYAGIATGTESSCCSGSDDCCGPTAERAHELGYSDSDLDAVAEGANLNLGCGNPTAIASLEAGDTVLDLGSGGGFDCFLAAREVGPDGRVIGVDMTPEMVEKARANVEKNDAPNVEFRLGEIEHLPVADRSVDVVLSNCVINLSPRKPQVFREAYRVLRPGGRLAVSDVVRTAEAPDGRLADLRADSSSVAACIGGAASVSAVESMLADAGFVDVSVAPKSDGAEFIREWDDDRDLSEYFASANIEAEKPATEADSNDERAGPT